MIRIDGTMGEGGGQVLRTALSLSVLTGKGIHLVRIRARRDRPGLAFQHRMAVHAVGQISGARMEGVRVGSVELRFEPGPIIPGEYRFDIGTAGAASLVLQTVLLPLAVAEKASRITVTGGTHVPFSPCYHYLDWHWRVLMTRIGVPFALEMPMAGFYPPGGGVLHAQIGGGARVVAAHWLDRGPLVRIRGLSAVALLPDEIAERQRVRALGGLRAQRCPVEIEAQRLPAQSPGTVLVLLAEFERSQACFFALGARGKRAERVADEAVEGLRRFLATDGAVDPWAADQLLLPLALASQPSAVRTAEVTRHLLTQAELIPRLLPVRIEVDGRLGEPGTVRVCP
ncbi:RNA 3'-terminal phosphate cyclase [Thioalkalivibrio nitratireducens]|nr:RNA 3'-terminal phosphate cyclase [Thioalkalivibrio nitratireducens]